MFFISHRTYDIENTKGSKVGNWLRKKTVVMQVIGEQDQTLASVSEGKNVWKLEKMPWHMCG